MQLFPVGRIYDFMGARRLFMVISVAMTVLALIVIWKPGPDLGTDFKGGTEIEVDLKKDTSTTEISDAVIKSVFLDDFAVDQNDDFVGVPKNGNARPKR